MYNNVYYFLNFIFLLDTHLYQYIHLLITGDHVTRKLDLVACGQQRRIPGCAFMQCDPGHCYSLITKYITSKLAS